MIKNKKIFTAVFAIIIALSSIMIVFEPTAAAPKANAGLLDPKIIPKYVNQLVANIPVFESTNITSAGTLMEQDYIVNMTYFREQILPTGTVLTAGSDGKTTVWGTQDKQKTQ